MFYTEITETVCKTVRFSGIYGLYVNNSVKKTNKGRFGYWRPWVRVPPLRPLRNHSNSKSLSGSFSFFVGLSPQGVLRRLASIVARRRSFLFPSTPCFARARRRKQLSTVSYSLTRRFDQKAAENEPFLTCFRLFFILFAQKWGFGGDHMFALISNL